MMRSLAALLLIWAVPLGVQAACTGTNQIDRLPGAERAALVAAADAAPFARGNLWQARRGGATVTLVGTLHVDDPRHDAVMARITPLIDAAATVLVEAGPLEKAALVADLATRPDLVFATTGPTLPERLPPETWERLKQALRSRGIPPFLAAKMQPAYLSMILSIPPCAADSLATGSGGLDGRIIARATLRGIPLDALEPHDTMFTIFAGLGDSGKDRMLDQALAMSDEAEDGHATLIDAYFAGQSRLIWELSRLQAVAASALPPETVAADFAAMEEALMLARNRRWLPVIEAAAARGPVLAAFGALHLSGHGGVLDLLDRAGYAITPLAP